MATIKSIEEKAKAYDKAIKRAKEMIKAMTNIGGVAKVDDIQYLFPELKESEDERIRKDMIDTIKQEAQDFPSSIIAEKSNKWIAWLEKQGEQKLYVNDNAKEMFIRALERVEEQNNKGYKLTDCDKNSWWEDFKNYTSCAIEQKPAEEYNITGIGSKNAQGKLGQMIKKLKPVNEVLEQNLTWSEEDEDNLNSAIYYIRREPYRECDVEPIVDWLKNKLSSLRPQSTWKPSDEQMKALKEAVDEHFDIDGGALWHLYEDLLKLMEK